MNIVLALGIAFWISLFVAPTALAQSQPTHTFLDLADRYVDQGNIDAAITEYYRHIYLHPNDDQLVAAYTKLGIACRQDGQQQACLRAFASALERCQTSEERVRVRLELATAHLLFDQPIQAQLVLMRIQSAYSLDSLVSVQVRSLLGVAALMTGQWAVAAEHLTAWSKHLANPAVTDTISMLLADTTDIPHRSPSVAKIMSAIIPGLGQMYCGEYLDGLNAMALNGALIWSVVTQVERQRYLAALMVGIPLVGRYYLGNLDHADMYARRFNERSRRVFASTVIGKIADWSE